MHARREEESLEMHRRVAARLRSDPERVLGKARANIRRWLAGREGTAAETVYREWLDVLDANGVEQLAEFLVSRSEKAVRLRQSNPFAGVLEAREVWEIKRTHAAART